MGSSSKRITNLELQEWNCTHMDHRTFLANNGKLIRLDIKYRASGPFGDEVSNLT